MLRITFRCVVAAIFLASSPGCGKPSPRSAGYSTALVHIIFDKKGNQIDKKIPIQDHDTVIQLLSFFPEADQGKSGGTPSGWESDVEIQVTRADGSILSIGCNFLNRLWSEGDGDYALSEPFMQFIQKLDEANKK